MATYLFCAARSAGAASRASSFRNEIAENVPTYDAGRNCFFAASVPVSGGRVFIGIGVFDGRLCRSGEDAPSGDGRGNFMLASHGADGSGAIETDPLATFPLFVVDSPEVLAVSTDIQLLARLCDHIGVKTKRSSLVFAAFVAMGTSPSNHSSIDGIELLPAGACVRISGDGRAAIRREPMSSLIYSDESYETLIDRAEAEIRANVRAVGSAGIAEKTCDLTGGMDSRLVLAALLAEGCQDDFTYRTRGTVSADAVVAEMIRGEFGLRRSNMQRKPGAPRMDKVADVRDALVRLNGVMEQMIVVGMPSPDQLALGGGMGELSRTFWSGAVEQVPLARLIANLRTRGKGAIAARAMDHLGDDLLADGRRILADGVKPEDAGDAFYLQSRNRYHFGVPWAGGTGKWHPLYSPAAIKAATRLDREMRKHNKVGFDLMKRLSPKLVGMPFADQRWHATVNEAGAAPISDADQQLLNGPDPSGSQRLRSVKSDFDRLYPKPDFSGLEPWFDTAQVARFLGKPIDSLAGAMVNRAGRMLTAQLWTEARQPWYRRIRASLAWPWRTGS